MGVLDASTSPPKERYAVSKDNIIKLIQPGNVDHHSPKSCAMGSCSVGPGGRGRGRGLSRQACRFEDRGRSPARRAPRSPAGARGDDRYRSGRRPPAACARPRGGRYRPRPHPVLSIGPAAPPAPVAGAIDRKHVGCLHKGAGTRSQRLQAMQPIHGRRHHRKKATARNTQTAIVIKTAQRMSSRL